MNKRFFGLIAVIFVICMVSATIWVAGPWSAALQQPQKELDFTVCGTNDCLRFLTKTVQTAYVPFRTDADEQWQLTIDSTMPAQGAWTDAYIYNGYWDNGTDYKCMSEDLYPIISQIETTSFQIKSNSTFIETFGASTPRSYTLFFIFPPGGTSTFNVKLEKIS
jgi:hypothetical protein